jgi:microcompartment protein CcmL/EutN
MEKDSLGLIEILGFVGAIEAADAGSKAANVTFRGYQRGLGGLITVMFTGDVAAVRAAVSAGVAAAKLVGKVISVDVIARPDRQLHVTPDGSKQVEQETPVTAETAPPAEPPEVIVSEEAVQLAEYAAPEMSVVVAEPMPANIDTAATETPEYSAVAVAEAAEYSAVAVAEAEEPVSPQVSEEPVQPPAQDWIEATPKGGGNGHPPEIESDRTEEVVAPEPVAPVRKKEREKGRKTKTQKRV